MPPPIEPIHTRAGNYYNDLAKGIVNGSSTFFLNGATPFVNSSTLDVWTWGDKVLTYLPPTSATINTISSDSNLDIGIPIAIKGLDENYNIVNQLAFLNGQNKVTLTTPLMRINSAINLSGLQTGTPATQLSGNVYIYEDGPILNGVPINPNLVKEHIALGRELSKHAFFTTAVGQYANFILLGSTLTKKGNGSAYFKAYQKTFGGVKIETVTFDLQASGTTNITVDLIIPVVVPPKTDFWITAEIDGNAIGCSSIASAELYYK